MIDQIWHGLGEIAGMSLDHATEYGIQSDSGQVRICLSQQSVPEDINKSYQIPWAMTILGMF
jgi:hypothetical protein